MQGSAITARPIHSRRVARVRFSACIRSSLDRGSLLYNVEQGVKGSTPLEICLRPSRHYSIHARAVNPDLEMAMHSPLYSVSLLVLGLLAMGACGESGSLPEDPDRASPAGPSLAAAASNSWSLKAALPTAAFAASAVSVTNGAGQSFVYAFGGRRNGEPDWPIEVYNVATDTWVARKTFADG